MTNEVREHSVNFVFSSNKCARSNSSSSSEQFINILKKCKCFWIFILLVTHWIGETSSYSGRRNIIDGKIKWERLRQRKGRHEYKYKEIIKKGGEQLIYYRQKKYLVPFAADHNYTVSYDLP